MRHAYLDEHSNLKSSLHLLDPRIKIICFSLFIVFIISTRPTAILSFSLYSLLIMLLIFISKIPPGFILKRSLVIIPFVLMIAIFIPFLKQGEVAGGYSFGSFNLKITYDGLTVFFNVLIKAFFSILLMIILVNTTKLPDLLKAFEKLKIPSIFIMILSFMYRYLFIIEDELMVMLQAKKARSIGGSRWFHTKALANLLGVLFIRSYERGEAVYLAMCSRGFSGQIKTIDNFKIRTKDFCFLLITISLLSVIKILSH